MTEAEQWVKYVLELTGWQVLRRGWPDFLIHRDGDVRAVEVKTDRLSDQPTGDQLRMGSALISAGVPVYIARPGDISEDLF